MVLDQQVSNKPVKNLIEFPIGDWSKDGHGKCDVFLAYSNKTVEELRECHFNFKDMFGFCIGDICHEIDYLSEKDYENFYKVTTIPEDLLQNLKDEENYMYDSEILFRIWKLCLQAADPSVIFEDVSPQSIVFAGYDDKRRHLHNPGYGLFD